jgi:hypothetical protein
VRHADGSITIIPMSNPLANGIGVLYLVASTVSQETSLHSLPFEIRMRLYCVENCMAPSFNSLSNVGLYPNGTVIIIVPPREEIRVLIFSMACSIFVSSRGFSSHPTCSRVDTYNQIISLIWPKIHNILIYYTHCNFVLI